MPSVVIVYRLTFRGSPSLDAASAIESLYFSSFSRPSSKTAKVETLPFYLLERVVRPVAALKDDSRIDARLPVDFQLLLPEKGKVDRRTLISSFYKPVDRRIARTTAIFAIVGTGLKRSEFTKQRSEIRGLTTPLVVEQNHNRRHPQQCEADRLSSHTVITSHARHI